jgi:hypothetical protein
VKAITTVQRSLQKLGQRGAIRRVPGMSGGTLHCYGFSRIDGLVESFTDRTMLFCDLCHFRIWPVTDIRIERRDVRLLWG